MEAQLLRDMIADRDKRIEKVKRKSEELRTRELYLCEQLEKIGKDAMKQKKSVEDEKKQLLKQYSIMVTKFTNLQSEFEKQKVSLRNYCQDIERMNNNKRNNNNTDDSSYVMRMQAQLCKAMHTMGITDHQLDLVKTHTDNIIKYQKDTITKCVEDKTQVELQLMNELMAKDTDKREIETKYTKQLDEIYKERDAVERQIDGSDDDDDESDSDSNASNNKDDDDGSDHQEDDEEDEEEKEAKQELMQLLTERRIKIETLEKEQEEKEETIQELEEQLREFQADEEQVKALAESQHASKSNLNVNMNSNSNLLPSPESSFHNDDDNTEEENEQSNSTANNDLPSAEDLLSAVANRHKLPPVSKDNDDYESPEEDEESTVSEEEE